MQIFSPVFHLFRILKTLSRRHPVKSVLFFLCLLIFVGVEAWFSFAPLPGQNWIVENLRKIHIEDSSDFSFAVLGDNKNSHTIFPVLLRKVDQDHDIKFALDLGDLVFDGEIEKYRYFIKQVENNTTKPFLTAIGNHELSEKGRGLYYDLFGPFYYSFQLGQTYFIVLDDADEKGLDIWQQGWLERELEQAQGYTSRFVFMHVPLFDPRGGEHHHCLPEKEARSLLSLFEKYHVSHIFTGHIHGYYRGQWEGIPFTITGGAGAELVGKEPKHDFFHYIKVSIKGNLVNTAVQPVTSRDYEWLDRLGSIAWLYIFSFVRFHGIQLALFLLMAWLLGGTLRTEQRKNGQKT